MNKMPLITVGVTTFNRKSFLREALNSIKKQTYKNFEIVLVDDGSSDGTGDMVHNEFPDVRYFYQDNAGVAAAKKSVVKHALGKYIMFCDSDDMLLPDALELLLVPLNDFPDACSYGHYIRMNSKGEPLPTKARFKKYPSGNVLPELLLQIFITNSNILMPVCLFQKFGNFDTSLVIAEDYSFLLEVMLHTPCYYVNAPVFLRRRHESNLTDESYEKESISFEVFSQFIARHPEVREKYEKNVRKRLSSYHRKLAREAARELRPKSLVRKHLAASLKESFSAKVLFRYLMSFL